MQWLPGVNHKTERLCERTAVRLAILCLAKSSSCFPRRLRQDCLTHLRLVGLFRKFASLMRGLLTRLSN